MSATGEVIQVTTSDESRQETAHRWPFFLPDGRHFLYVARSSQQKENAAIYVGSLDSKEVKRITSADFNVSYTPPGYLLLFAAGGHYQKARAMEESTVYSYDSMLRNLVFPSFGSLRMDRITPQHLTRLMKAAREKPYSSKYRLNLYSMLKIMFDVAQDYDLISASPVRAKLHRPVHERTEKRSFTPEQVRALTQHVPENYGLMFFTAGVLGLRVGEVLPLEWVIFRAGRYTYGEVSGEE